MEIQVQNKGSDVKFLLKETSHVSCKQMMERIRSLRLETFASNVTMTVHQKLSVVLNKFILKKIIDIKTLGCSYVNFQNSFRGFEGKKCL